ncbi:TMEM175 family protein [Bradyrhizobium sp. SZCCHNS3002]|uniref:TMEM175 family protein n=1 Tax=Bradyrhizobium sp. SZCCHNS3002 TaxID=3057310 RepID=UPI0028E298FC|nr:TMEM175 family protein [Bradyrhizobium sp. SZCCHNS3002]
MTEPQSDLFEMRRLESLSNTIFGVAMTLLAYDLPKPNFAHMPGWIDLVHTYSGRLAGLVLSFIIAGVFWISHHRRLARQPFAGRPVVILNLFFLLSIVLLPVTNGLYGGYRLSSAVAVLYGLHLTIIASLNAALWWLALPSGRHAEIAGAIFPVIVFVPGIVIAAIAPEYVQYFWMLGFGGFLARRFVRSPRAAPAGEKAELP